MSSVSGCQCESRPRIEQSFLDRIFITLAVVLRIVSSGSLRRSHSDGQTKEYAFEMATSNIRYGEGVTREVGMDIVNLGIKHICVFTDPNVRPIGLCA